MKKIFGNIQINKRLGIIQYNKTIQQKLDLCINDYSQLYFSIEIEIKPIIKENGILLIVIPQNIAILILMTKSKKLIEIIY